MARCHRNPPVSWSDRSPQLPRKSQVTLADVCPVQSSQSSGNMLKSCFNKNSSFYEPRNCFKQGSYTIDTVTFLVLSCLLGQIWHRSFAALSAKNWQGHIKHHQTSQSSRCAQDKQRSCWQQGSWRLCCTENAAFPVCHGLQKCCAKSSLEGLKANCSKGRADHLKRKQLSLGEGLAIAGNYYPGCKGSQVMKSL